MRFFDSTRARRDLRLSRNAWRNKAYAAMDAERELAEMNVALRRRMDVLEARPGVTAANVRLAHELEQVEARLVEERELHHATARLLRRYVDLHGDITQEAGA